MDPSDETVVRDTQRWLERAVIGLNLCPFAKAVHVKGLVHFAVSAARDANTLLEDVRTELDALAAVDIAMRETTLLIAPHCLPEFLEFNDFLARADRVLRNGGFEGVIQLASFHPHYRFEGAEEGDVTNFTNRSPYPIVHLLREESIDRAVESFPDAESIYEANMDTMRRIGRQGWDELGVGPRT
jgi:hypothetical protein